MQRTSVGAARADKCGRPRMRRECCMPPGSMRPERGDARRHVIYICAYIIKYDRRGLRTCGVVWVRAHHHRGVGGPVRERALEHTQRPPQPRGQPRRRRL